MKHIKFFIAAALLVFAFNNSKANNLSGSVKPLVLQVRTPPAPPAPPRISIRHHRYGRRHHRSLNLHVHLPPPPPAPPRP